MPINIQSLFQDIIETPAQRQQRMLQEGILKGRELTAGLTGLARTQAPLVSALMMNMPRQQEALRRGVGGMLGLDVRSESEKVQDLLRTADVSTPQGMINLANSIQKYAPAQAQTLRAAAVEKQQEIADREREIQRQNAADARAEASAIREQNREARAEASWLQSFINTAEDRNIAAQERFRTEQERTSYNNRLEAIRNMLPANSPYRDLLQGPNVSESLLRTAIESTKQEQPKIDIRNTFDATTNTPVIMGINEDTGEVAWQISVGTKPEQATQMTDDQRKRLIEDVKLEPILQEIVATKRTGFAWLNKTQEISEGDIADLIYRISQQYGISLVQAKQAIKDTYKSENGKAKIISGSIDVSQFAGLSNTDGETNNGNDGWRIVD